MVYTTSRNNEGGTEGDAMQGKGSIGESSMKIAIRGQYWWMRGRYIHITMKMQNLVI